MSTKKIRDVSDVATKVFGLIGAKMEGERNIVDILDIYLPQLMPAFALMVLDDHHMPNEYARTYPEHSLIQVRSTVYEGARKGCGRDRFTLTHELGHLFLHKGITPSYARNDGAHKTYEDSEWQADTFAAEFLMPFNEARRMSSPDEMMRTFGVSYQAAQRRYDAIKKH